MPTENALLLIAKSDKILVAGAGGFIGGHFIKNLIQQGFYNIRAVDIKPRDTWFQKFDTVDNSIGDLRLLDTCHTVMNNVDWVFNFACDMGGMGFIENHKVECMLSVLANTHLLVAAHNAGVKRFLYSSSACVYRADKQTSTDVTALTESDAYPAMPEDGYGWEKLFSERMSLHFAEDNGLLTRIPRLHNVYGPMGTFDGGREKAPAAICRKVAMAKLSGLSDIEIWGDGHQTRSFQYIDDCVLGVQKIFSSDITEPINLGSSEMVSINQLVDMVEAIAGITLNRAYKLDAPKGVRGRNSDNTLLKSYTGGWEPSTPLREGLGITYRWIEEQYRQGLKD